MDLLKIVIFAIAAGIVILRLRSVLGRRTGHERQPPTDGIIPGRRLGHGMGSPEAGPQENVVPLPGHANDDAETATRTGVGEDDALDDAGDDAEAPAPTNDKLAEALAQIGRADTNFDVDGFRAGAQAAFEITIVSYAAGDKETLHPLLSEEVYANFTAAIAKRQTDDLTLETTLVGVRECDIIDAELDGRDAVITVKFVSEQINVTRDGEDRVIDGDPSQISKVIDIWTFSRSTKSRSPNWVLVATDTPN